MHGCESWNLATRRPKRSRPLARSLGALLLVATALPSGAAGQAEMPLIFHPGHRLHHLRLPPGQIGREQLLKQQCMPGYFQPVEVRGPEGTQIAIAVNGGYTPTRPNQLKAGLLIGRVYRYRVGNIPQLPGVEVYPTVEVINRLHPPPGLEAKFPIPVELTRNELAMAVQGRFVTRVIYLEDPNIALPIQGGRGVQPVVEVDSAADPLLTADRLGRPVAILRMGSRVPVEGEPDPHFAYGMPPAQLYEEVVDEAAEFEAPTRDGAAPDASPAPGLPVPTPLSPIPSGASQPSPIGFRLSPSSPRFP